MDFWLEVSKEESNCCMPLREIVHVHYKACFSLGLPDFTFIYMLHLFHKKSIQKVFLKLKFLCFLFLISLYEIYFVCLLISSLSFYGLNIVEI